MEGNEMNGQVPNGESIGAGVRSLGNAPAHAGAATPVAAPTPVGTAANMRPGATGPRRRKVRVEVEVPESLMGEFDLMMQELLVGKRTRLEILEREWSAIETRAMVGLNTILESIRSHPGTGQVGRLVAFLAGLYNGSDYPFDLSDLRPLDTKLANACLDYLNYDRLGVCDLDRHLGDEGRELEGWIRDYNIVPVKNPETGFFTGS